MANINDFKSRLAGGGARANQFRVILPPPVGQVTAASILNSLHFCVGQHLCLVKHLLKLQFHSEVEQLYVAGERTFDTWTTTVFNDTDFGVRREVERWMNGINDLINNTGATNPSLITE